MISRSSTSSSEQREPVESSRRSGSFRTLRRQIPPGAAWALVFVPLVHLAGMLWLEHPVARQELRRKVDALTASARPSVVLAGDSRVCDGMIPAVVAGELNLPRAQVVNIATAGCDSSAMWLAYREFAPQLAPRPVLVMDVSLFSVNDDADLFMGDELLWELSFQERCKLVPPGRAIGAWFFPEKAIWTACTSFWCEEATLADGGYSRKNAKRTLTRLNPEAKRQAGKHFERRWYGQPRTDGVKWAKLERDLRAFVEAGVQLVILDPPYHPEFAEFTRPEIQRIDRAFHPRLARLGQQLGVPVLTCAADWYGDTDPDLLFSDFVHLNGPGAELYSRIVASRVRELADAGLVRLDGHGTMLAAAQDRHAQDE